MKKITIDAKKCSGCRYCELACVFNKEKTIQPSLARVTVFYNWDEGISVPVMCYHCEDAPCIKSCPTEALHRDENDAVIVDYEKCIGCRLCTISCPFGAVTYSVEKSKIIKCDLCSGDPICVKFCPTGALKYEEPEKISIEKKRIVSENILISVLAETLHQE
ncbi:MAG: 4Fe-4S dicluster domain-containing protein [Endomicrobia bacterium]|nr:4Fe-4S dicluster domain-containing protein [Endomicrobiia bacterium]MCX7941359.1 4Fe-4S dicluster domain-containing protein [Endomicrobiia bacterium]MDW8055572.1 4Fe-4S dicluster domain-containing protein [Elusimicrobiota bacterium]